MNLKEKFIDFNEIYIIVSSKTKIEYQLIDKIQFQRKLVLWMSRCLKCGMRNYSRYWKPGGYHHLLQENNTQLENRVENCSRATLSKLWEIQRKRKWGREKERSWGKVREGYNGKGRQERIVELNIIPWGWSCSSDV